MINKLEFPTVKIKEKVSKGIVIEVSDNLKMARGFRIKALDRFTKNKRAMFGFITILLEILIVVFIPLIFKLDPISSDFDAGFKAQPSIAHILGTDAAGRDLFARTIWGGRVSLLVGILATAISVIIGLPLGLIAGYYRGIAESIIMRCADIFMSFPSMILILILVSIVGQSIITVFLVIGIMGWTGIAKLVYGNVLSIRDIDYINAARTIGKSDMNIIFTEVLPNVISPVWVTLSFRVGGAILAESGLSFLGVGIQPPNASWGNILNAAQDVSILMTKPWMWIPSGILITVTVVAFNFIGEGVRDAFDPRMNINK